MPPQIIVMGVCGCGKTSVGGLLANALGCAMVEGDDLHPPTNIALMSAGIALTDEDRRDWLVAIGHESPRPNGKARRLSCPARPSSAGIATCCANSARAWRSST